jgi:hypothetical protein
MVFAKENLFGAAVLLAASRSSTTSSSLTMVSLSPQYRRDKVGHPGRFHLFNENTFIFEKILQITVFYTDLHLSGDSAPS